MILSNISFDNLLSVIFLLLVYPFMRRLIEDTLRNFNDKVLDDQLDKEDRNEILDVILKYIRSFFSK